MQQVLFHLPIFKDWFPPDGVPVHGFGVMLFVTFVLGVWYLGWRSATWKTNLPRDRVQDLVIALFVAGLLGARVTYMLQYGIPLRQIFRIWEGGIVLYGGIIAGVLAYLAIYHFFLRKVGVSFWRLADAIAPGLALGIALGRIGCFLNGCCYGHVACEDCPQLAFPTLTAPAAQEVVKTQNYQTTTGFTVVRTRDPADFRSVVDRVEPASAAERAGLQPGDRIAALNGVQNGGNILVYGPSDAVDRAAQWATEIGARVVEFDAASSDRHLRAVVDDVKAAKALLDRLNADPDKRTRAFLEDVFTATIDPRAWPRGQQSLELEVERNGSRLTIGPFTPRTVGLHPTQLYETISMLLLVAFLTFFYPFRGRDGRVFVAFLACYAVHRFLNEMLRNDTDVVAFAMTISQNISVLMVLFAVFLAVIQRYTSPRIAAGPNV